MWDQSIRMIKVGHIEKIQAKTQEVKELAK